MNLHRHRVGWWEEALSQCSEPKAGLISSALAEHKYPTDRTVTLPSRFTRYVHDAKVFLRKPSDDPDDTFFQKKWSARCAARATGEHGKMGISPPHS